MFNKNSKEGQLISIAVATYNGEKYLVEQLDSIYAQTHKNIEVIVTDDGSIDATIKILKEYKKSHGLQYYTNDANLGFVKNFERAISLCSGDYIALADQDDIWEENKLEVLLKEIGHNLLIHSDCKIIDEKNNIVQNRWKEKIGFDISVEKLMFANSVTGCTVLFKKELTVAALPFPDGLAYHDWWLAMSAAMQNKIIYTEEPLTRYRQHMGQNTGADNQDNLFIVKRVFVQIFKRLKGVEFSRFSDFRKQRKNLFAIRNRLNKDYAETQLLDDAIEYFDDYIKNHIHIKTFLMGLKYNKILYPKKNYFYVKNILNDLVG